LFGLADSAEGGAGVFYSLAMLDVPLRQWLAKAYMMGDEKREVGRDGFLHVGFPEGMAVE
jgi:hypothetical protein